MTLEQFLNTLKSLGVSKISLEFESPGNPGSPTGPTNLTYGEVNEAGEIPKVPEIPQEMIDEEF